ncbi:MAG: LysR family transcriptional regulator [Oscillospiraceae bacterium]
MDFKQLREFDAVSRYNNITQASIQLQTSQPSLSRSIAKLEQELDHKLFYRTGNNIYLTSYGKLFRDRIAEILRLSELSDPIYVNSHGMRSFNICITYTDPEVINAIVNYEQHNSDITLCIYYKKSEKIFSELDIYDLIISNRILTTTEQYSFSEFANKDNIAVIPADNELAKRDYVTLHDIHKYPGVYLSGGDMSFTFDNLDRIKTEYILVNKVLLKCKILSLGIYVGVIPSYFKSLFKNTEKIVFLPLKFTSDKPKNDGRFIYAPKSSDIEMLKLIDHIRTYTNQQSN